MKTIAITGSNGNLGTKLTSFLVEKEWCKKIIAIDKIKSNKKLHHKINEFVLDLIKVNDNNLIEILKGVDTFIHLSCQNPFPDATWEDSYLSFDMTLKIFNILNNTSITKFIYTSSNHVMGGYKDSPLNEQLSSLNPLTTSLTPSPGTIWNNSKGVVNSTPYAVSKLMCERLFHNNFINSKLKTIIIRIGWCQTGINNPQTIDIDWTKSKFVIRSESDKKNLKWFQQMWLSNNDYNHLFEQSITTDLSNKNYNVLTINGMSNNKNMLWDILNAKNEIYYNPKDDVNKWL